jgi:hypothetical protein
VLSISSEKMGGNRRFLSHLSKKSQAGPLGQPSDWIKWVLDPFHDNAGRQRSCALNTTTEHVIAAAITDQGGLLKMKGTLPGALQDRRGAKGDHLPLDFTRHQGMLLFVCFSLLVLSRR